MGQRRVVSSELVAQSEERFLRLARPRHESESPIGDLLFSGEPFVGPGKKDGSSQAAFHDAIDMPAEHLGLLLLGMAYRVHAEFTQDEGPILGEILQAKEVALEVPLVVKINVKAGEIAVLRKEEFRRRIARVGKKHVWIDLAPDSNQLLDELRHPFYAKPADHRARDLVAHEITEDRGMTAIHRDLRSNHLDDLAARLAAQKLDMFGPGQRNEDTHSCGGAAIQKPNRRDVINPDDVEPCFPHLREIALHLGARAEVMAFRVRLERPVGNALDEKFPVVFEEKFRDRANRARRSSAHSGSLIVQAARRRKGRIVYSRSGGLQTAVFLRGGLESALLVGA